MIAGDAEEGMCEDTGKVFYGKKERKIISTDRRIKINEFAARMSKDVVASIPDNEERQLFLGMLATLIDVR